MILISIVIPTFNRAHVLSRAIDSIIAQTYSNWELLIVDDGSDDGTEELVAEYMNREPRIKFLKRPSDRLRGGNACRNIGAEYAAGEYVAYLDSDDYWKKGRLLGCIEFINKTKCDCLYSGRIISKHNIQSIGRSRMMNQGESAFDFLLSKNTLAVTPSLVLKAQIVQVIKWDESLLRHQDWDFFIRISKKFKWRYFDNLDVVCVNDSKGQKKIDISSCLKVYNKYKNEISDLGNHRFYLRFMMELSAKSFYNLKYVKIYHRLLMECGYRYTIRDKFQVHFPLLFFVVYRVKRKIFNFIF